MGNTLTYKQMADQMEAKLVSQGQMAAALQHAYDTIFNAPLVPPSGRRLEPGQFTPAQRITALRGAAQWCREGAPGGAPSRLFSPQGPCALGYALLELHNDERDWRYSGAGKGMHGAAEYLTGIPVDEFSEGEHRELALVNQIAGCFDHGWLLKAAWLLDLLADMIAGDPRAELSWLELEAEEAKRLAGVFTEATTGAPSLLSLYVDEVGEADDEAGYLTAMEITLSQEKTHAVLTPA